MKPKNFPGRVKARQRVALEQVEARISRNGESPDPDVSLTKDQKRKRVEQAKHEKAILEKRI